MIKKRTHNIIKTREDAELFYFDVSEEPQERTVAFNIPEGCTKPSWADSEGKFDRNVLRQRIEPWLTSLFQSDHLSLLAGSGLTHAVHEIVTGASAAGMSQVELGGLDRKINEAAEKSSAKAKRKNGNFEDQLRTAFELLKGLEILKDPRADELAQNLEVVMESFAESILESERNIANNVNKQNNNEKEAPEEISEAAKTSEKDLRQKAFNTLVSFLMSFTSRVGARDRLSIFTTNYDRLIEAGAELAGIHLLDRFVGNLFPIFRSSRLDLDIHYNPPGIRGEPRYLEGVARYTKLHGSVDWVQTGDDIRRFGLPFGATSVEPYLNASGLKDVDAHKFMVYPNAAKDQETANYPYVELFRDFAAAICRPNNTLVTYGYSFGDEHINRIIRDMLTIPSAHLVIISYGDELGRIMTLYEELGRDSQITLLIGPELANIENLTRYYLPKAAIDKTMSRMAELLAQRIPLESKCANDRAQDSKGGDPQ